MILSVHLAPLAPRRALAVLRRPPAAGRAPGLRWAQTAVAAPLGAPFPPRPHGVGLIAAWDDDAALDGFLAHDELARRLAGGWRVRLDPLRGVGHWPAVPELTRAEKPADGDGPVAVLTLGRPRLRRAVPFLRASAPAERQAVADPALLLATGLARPPGLVSTFSVWRSAAEMRAYAAGGPGGAHVAAMRAHAARPFHHHSVFARFRPYGERGEWQGRTVLGDRVAVTA